MQVLRDYQVQAIEELRAKNRAGFKTLLLVAPTGSGKTTIAAAMIRSASQRGSKILFLAHRKELIDQCSERLDGLDIDHGIIKASHWRSREHLPVQVASVQTYVRRETAFVPNLIFIDECHRARAGSYQEILSRYPDATTIGLTATPVRSDGKGLGKMFSTMVECPGINELIALGYLVPVRAWTQPKPDLSGVSKTAGDYKLDELSARMNTSVLVGNIVGHYQKHAANRQAVVFAVDVQHSKTITTEFVRAGIPAEHLDGNTPNDEREAILKRLASCQTRVVSNCQVLSEGWDCPIVSCVILARPTMSMGLYLQMSGRALRPAPGKENCVILDHAGCVHAHGLVDSDREWDLIEDKIKKRVSISTADPFKVCPECDLAVDNATKICPNCGYQFAVADDTLKHVDGELIEASGIKYVPESSRRRKYEWYLHQAAYQRRMDGTPYKEGYPAVRYKNEFHDWPPRKWKREWLANQPAGFTPNWISKNA